MRTFGSFLVVLLLGLGIVGCGILDTAADESEDTANANLNSVAETSDMLSGEIDIVGSTTVQPLAELIGAAYNTQHPNVDLNIGAGGSEVGIQAIQNGDADIGMASRRVGEEEMQPGMVAHQIAIDVLAVIVHPSNPVTELTLEELQQIYFGEITNWSEVGGPDMPILPVVREVTSGTRGAFDDIALDGQDPNEEIVDVQITAGEVEARVASSENAIGYVGFGHIELDEINLLAIDGVEPSPEAALDGSYQLQRPLILLTGSLSRELSESFVNFALSDEGQDLVIENGWVEVGMQQ